MGCPNASVRLIVLNAYHGLVSAPAVRVPSAAAGPTAAARGTAGGFFSVPVLVLAAVLASVFAAGAGRAAVCISVLRWSRSVIRLSVACLTSSAVSGASGRGAGRSWTAGKMVSVLQPATRKAIAPASAKPASSRLVTLERPSTLSPLCPRELLGRPPDPTLRHPLPSRNTYRLNSLLKYTPRSH